MNINIKIEKETRKVWADKYTIGNDGENLQCNLVFTFDEFVDGQAMLFYEIDDESRFDYLAKVNEQYILPIKSTLTKQGTIPMQLVITEGINENEVPIFKTNIFKVNIGSSIEDGIEQPEEYPSWLEIANTKLNQVDNLDIDLKDGVVTIFKKDGTTESENVKGDDYVITDEDYQEIGNQVKTDIQPILENIENVANQAEVIARGRATGYTFETVEDLDIWLQDETNVSKLTLGDNFYIIATDVPDYWWDGAQKRVLETEKPDLTAYAKKGQFVTLTQEEYDNLETKSANTYYFIIEEE